MKMKIVGLVITGLMFAAATSAQAAVLTVDGGTATTINGVATSAFDDVGTGLDPNASPIQFYDSSAVSPFGLSLSEAANVTFEFLGKEAVFLNTFSVAGNTFTNGTTAPGTTFSTALAGGVIPFTFTSLGAGKIAVNDGTIESPLAFAIAALSNTSVILLFDDGGPGIDLDDMAIKVSVSQVPLPPAVWLLISAILGLVSFSRIRRNGTTTA